MKITKIIYVLLAVFALGCKASAGDKATKDPIQLAQDKLETTFSNITSTYFGESEVEGVFEILAGSRIIYYAPKSDVLIFGEMFSKEGRSLTAEKMASLKGNKVRDLDLSHALVLGDGEKVIIEFTDPDCTYCRKLHKKLHVEENIKRVIFFMIPEGMHPQAKKKAVHILCSSDKKDAFNNVFTRRVPLSELEDCAEGRNIVEIHKTVSKTFGVAGTPTVILGDSVVTGFREAQIAQYLDN